jgi:homoserine dehydrogenase
LRNDKFSTIINEALEKGYTEPDPREDLSGNDVARKLLILARELDLINEFEDINIQNLVPESLLSVSKSEFLSRLEELDEEYQKIKENQEPGHVLRYVGDLHGDLQKEKGELDVTYFCSCNFSIRTVKRFRFNLRNLYRKLWRKSNCHHGSRSRSKGNCKRSFRRYFKTK